MLNIPFDYRPTSVSTKTSSYTIPSNSYAHVSVRLGWVSETAASFTIDGNTAFFSSPAGAESGSAVPIAIAEFWLAPSTVISGSGSWSALVTLYSGPQ